MYVSECHVVANAWTCKNKDPLPNLGAAEKGQHTDWFVEIHLRKKIRCGSRIVEWHKISESGFWEYIPEKHLWVILPLLLSPLYSWSEAPLPSQATSPVPSQCGWSPSYASAPGWICSHLCGHTTGMNHTVRRTASPSAGYQCSRRKPMIVLKRRESSNLVSRMPQVWVLESVFRVFHPVFFSFLHQWTCSLASEIPWLECVEGHLTFQIPRSFHKLDRRPTFRETLWDAFTGCNRNGIQFAK